MMLALLLALAPVASPYFGNCIGDYASLNARECPSQHCEHADCRDELERARAGEPHFRADVLCGPFSTDAECWKRYPVLNAPDPWVSYCIWRSDGTVEAKNATCSDRKGERQ